MTSAPVRDPLAEHLITPQNAACTPPSNTATRSRMPGPGEPANRLDQVTIAHLLQFAGAGRLDPTMAPATWKMALSRSPLPRGSGERT